MNLLTIAILVFAAIGALDHIFGNKFGLGKEFEKAFMLLGTMALSVVGMVVIAPLIADILSGVSMLFSRTLRIDPSVLPAFLFANDMGGASLATQMAYNDMLGDYNAFIVSSMMGCTVSFTVPFALGVVKKEQYTGLFFGLLCGIITIPIGCFVSGIVCRIPIGVLLFNLLPLVLFSGIIAVCLAWRPRQCIKAFQLFGYFIRALITVGLLLGIINYLTGTDTIKGIAPIEDGAMICINAAIVLSGMFPLIHVLIKLLSRPLTYTGRKIGMNEVSVVGLLSVLASSAPTFGIMEKMDSKGVILNSAFAVSGAFVFGSHMAFTMAYDRRYLLPMVIGKLISGFSALFVAAMMYRRWKKEDANQNKLVNEASVTLCANQSGEATIS